MHSGSGAQYCWQDAGWSLGAVLRQFVDVSTAHGGWGSSTLSDFGFQYCSQSVGGAVVGRVIDVSTACGMLEEQYSFWFWQSLLLMECWQSSSGPGNRCEYCLRDAEGAVLFLILAITTAHGMLTEQYSANFFHEYCSRTSLPATGPAAGPATNLIAGSCITRKSTAAFQWNAAASVGQALQYIPIHRYFPWLFPRF